MPSASKRLGNNPLRPSYARNHPDVGNPLYTGSSNQSPQPTGHISLGHGSTGLNSDRAAQLDAYRARQSLPAKPESRQNDRVADSDRRPLPAKPVYGTGANQTPLGPAQNSGFNIRGGSTESNRAGAHARMTANNIASGYYGNYTAPNVTCGIYPPPSNYYAPSPYRGGLQGNWYQ